MTGQGTCYLHSPAAAEARARGGKAKAAKAQAPGQGLDVTRLPLRNHEDCRRACELVTQAVLAGTIHHNAGTVASSLIKTAQKSIDDVMARQVAALLERLKGYEPQTARRRR